MKKELNIQETIIITPELLEKSNRFCIDSMFNKELLAHSIASGCKNALIRCITIIVNNKEAFKDLKFWLEAKLNLIANTYIDLFPRNYLSVDFKYQTNNNGKELKIYIEMFINFSGDQVYTYNYIIHKGLYGELKDEREDSQDPITAEV